MLPEQVLAAARTHWNGLDGRSRRALLLAARAGHPVTEPVDAAVAVHLADRERDRLAHLLRPRRLWVWRILHGVFATWFAVVAVVLAVRSEWLSLPGPVALGGLFGSSAVLARKRLERRLERVEAGRAANLATALEDAAGYGLLRHGDTAT